MNYNDRSWAEVNLDAIKSNVVNIKSYLDNKTKIMAVVKADAYGHGCLETVNTLIENGVDYLAVACPDEAILLRKRGINIPILILGYSDEDRFEEIVDYDITQTVFNLESAKRLSQTAVKKNKKAKIHIKIDTGMARIGYLYGYSEEIDVQTENEILKIVSLDGIDAEGIFTHFSVADEPDDDFTNIQFDRFNKLLLFLEENGVKFKYRHCCNSAATIMFPKMHLDMVRPGIIIYGVYPSEKVKAKIDLIPAMQVKTRVVNINKIYKNSPISYGKTYKSDKDITVATIPIGYADGFPRMLSNKGKIIANGKIVPVLGRICMDQCMIDVTSVNNINVGDEVTVFGSQGESFIPVESIAEISGTINYEILCSVGKRIPRIYLKDGSVTKVLNFLN
ncbi:MAG: alanine racemase [Clostridia bacterium]|nr:alanine racemase [Clostridia bacterium]